MSDLRSDPAWREHTAALADAGWERIDDVTGYYRHSTTGAEYDAFLGLVRDGRATHVWRVYHERGELPDPAVGKRERHRMVREAQDEV